MIRVMFRALKKQYAISKNTGDSISSKVIRLVWFIFFSMKAIGVGLKSLSSEQLGSSVLYRGKKCFISNWAGSEHPTLASDGFYEEYCNRNEITQVHNIMEYCHRFSFGFSFFMNNWIDISIQQKLNLQKAS